MVENQFYPATAVVTKIMLNQNVIVKKKKKKKSVPLSNDVVCQRIDIIGINTVDEVDGSLGESYILVKMCILLLSRNTLILKICVNIYISARIRERNNWKNISNIVNTFFKSEIKILQQWMYYTTASMTGYEKGSGHEFKMKTWNAVSHTMKH